MRASISLQFDTFTNADWGPVDGVFIQCLCGATGNVREKDLEEHTDDGSYSCKWACPNCDALYHVADIVHSHSIPWPSIYIELPEDVGSHAAPAPETILPLVVEPENVEVVQATGDVL